MHNQRAKVTGRASLTAWMHLYVDGERNDCGSADSASRWRVTRLIAALELPDHAAAAGQVCETLGRLNRVS
jgi:hypothetical protein